MRNRAKCKLCNEILESFHSQDYVTCKCGEISIDGGANYCWCSAKDWNNFLRVDDEGNEILVKVHDKSKDESTEQTAQEPPPMTREDKIEMLEALVKNYTGLPVGAMVHPVNHYDMYSLAAIILAIFKHEKNS